MSLDITFYLKYTANTQKVNENLEKTAKTQEKPVYFLRFFYNF